MFLYIIRHGDADNRSPSDAERALTPLGIETVQKMARHVTSLIEKPSLLFSSPFLRAQQTAQTFAELWALKINSADWLLPGVAPSLVLQELRKYSEEGIALVGHLPNLGLLLGSLVWGLPPKEVVIPKGGVGFLNLLSWDPGTAKLKWVLTPDVLP